MRPAAVFLTNFGSRCKAAGGDAPKIEKGEITPEKQPKESTTAYARMIKKEDGRIDWTKSAIEIERQIRAMSPWPSALQK